MKKENQHTILKTNDLSIGYKTKKETTVVSKDINLNFHSGELIGLVGANGIGKSTLLRTLTKVQPELSGDIYIKDKLLSDYTNIQLAKVLSLVLTDPLASKNLTAFELIALGRQPYTNWLGNLSEKDLKIVNYAVEQIQLEDIIHKKCYELSDGQLQKVMIARALAQDTNLIILDEPTTHLDLYHKAYIFKLLQKLSKTTQKTILFSTHELDLAIQLCDKLIVMTDTNVVIDEPCNLIQSEVFSEIFPKDLIAFDTKTGSFKVKK